MTKTIWMLPPEKDYKAARHQFLEIYGAATVTNAYLRIAVVGLCATCLLLGVLFAHELHKPPERIVVGIHDSGKVAVLASNALDYQPHEAELKYFLTDFVQRHYGRMRATLRENYARSLYFLDGQLADTLMEENRRTQALETFLAGQGEESDIIVKNVSLEDLRTSPYRATVDFERVIYGTGNRSVLRRETYVGNFVFVVKSEVPNAQIPINPLGLTITYFRQDQAFH